MLWVNLHSKTMTYYLITQVIAYACVVCLLSMNLILVFTISFFVLQSASAVFPACQHGFVGSNLADSLPTSTLKKIQKFYFAGAGEKRLAVIEDEDAAMQNVMREETGGDDISRESDDALPLDFPVRQSKVRNSKRIDDRKVFISFADSVGEILRQKLQNSSSKNSSSNVPEGSVNFSGDSCFVNEREFKSDLLRA